MDSLCDSKTRLNISFADKGALTSQNKATSPVQQVGTLPGPCNACDLNKSISCRMWELQQFEAAFHEQVERPRLAFTGCLWSRSEAAMEAVRGRRRGVNL